MQKDILLQPFMASGANVLKSLYFSGICASIGEELTRCMIVIRYTEIATVHRDGAAERLLPC